MMLAHKIAVFGKTIPVWMAALALVAATAGAAVGVVLSGSVKGEIVTTITQSLLVYKVASNKATDFGAVSDDGTKFTAAVEMQQGDDVHISLFANNKSTDRMAVLVRLDLPPGITADVTGRDGAAGTKAGITAAQDSCVRVSLTDFKCKLAADSAATSNATTLGATASTSSPNITVVSTTGYEVGDQLTVGPDTRRITVVVSSTVLTLDSNPSAAHAIGTAVVKVNANDVSNTLGSAPKVSPVVLGAEDFVITLALHDEVLPGFYTTGVTMTQIESK